MRWILAIIAVATAAAATVILHSDFGAGPGEWNAMGDSGHVRATREAADTREGHPSMAFDYEVGAGKFSAAVMPVPNGTLTDLDQLHFWMKTEFATSVVVTMNEKGGGNYVSMSWSPGGVWQEVRLEPRDFSLSTGPKDPPDPDGKLDPKDVQAIGMTDIAIVFGAGPRNPNLPFAVANRTGKHTLLVSDFEALGGLPKREDNLVIDSFESPQLKWSSPGGAMLRLDDSREHAPGPAMEVSYTQAEGAIVVFSRNLPPNIPGNITHISFDIASEKAASFVFTLQETGTPGHGDGPRYTTVVEVRGKGRPDHRDLSLSAFNLEQNGPPDPAGALNISKVKNLNIADISAALNGDKGANRMWISNIRLIVKN